MTKHATHSSIRRDVARACVQAHERKNMMARGASSCTLFSDASGPPSAAYVSAVGRLHLSLPTSGLSASSETVLLPSSPHSPALNILGVDVKQLPDGSCEIIRSYDGGIATSERISPVTGSSPSLRWHMTAAARNGTPRRALRVVTSINVSSLESWWAPLERPIDPANSTNPLLPLVGVGGEFEYGGKLFDVHQTDGAPPLSKDAGVTLPLTTWLSRASSTSSDGGGEGLSLALDPTDSTTLMRLRATLASGGLSGAFAFDRRLLSVGGNATALSLSADWITHEGCWRPALGWFISRYPSHMAPHPNVDLGPLDGAGAYAYLFEGQARPPRSHYSSMGLRANWDASFPWLYHGPWVPFHDARYFPLASSSSSSSSSPWEWINCNPAGHGKHQSTSTPDWPRCVNMSYGLLRRWYEVAYEETGATTLVYGTIEEFGMGMREVTEALPECAAAARQNNYTASLICGANRLLRDRFPNAILRNAANHSHPVNAAWTSFIMDAADPQYEDFLLENTRRVRDELGGGVGMGGVCLDRGDWIYLVNAAADDGTSATADGRPARTLINSWRQVMPKIGALLHAASPTPLALFVNPDIGHRADMYEGVDGVYDEMGDPTPGGARTASGWLTAGGKVGIIWCHDPNAGYGNATKCAAVMTNGTDGVRHRFLQSHLLYGLYPSVPVIDNDHQIQPAARADRFYARYGAIWAAMRRKRWLTEAHAIAVLPPSGGVMANAFERQPYGTGRYIVAVSFGAGGNATIRLALPELRAASAGSTHGQARRVSAVATMLDGVRIGCEVRPSAGHPGRVDVVVPLQADGCAAIAIEVSPVIESHVESQRASLVKL